VTTELRVLAIVPAPLDTSPGQRFRIEQWDSHLRKEGIEITYAPFLAGGQARLLAARGHMMAKAWTLVTCLGRRLLGVIRSGAFDAAYVFRETAHLGPALAERVLVRKHLPFVFDFDDAVWIDYRSPANPFFSRLRFPGKTVTACRLASQVWAGNLFLREWAARHNGSVEIVPTTIDTEKYSPVPRRPPSSNPVVGWTGSFSTVRYLDLVRPALERLRSRLSFRLVVVGGGDVRIPGVEVENRPWCASSEVTDLRDLDIGIMPLPDSDWERGKCGLKALQYMALAIPPVVSPVGVNREVVSHGRDGLHARTPEEWEHALATLLQSPQARAQLGDAARATVERSYSAQVHAPRVAALMRRLAGGVGR